MRAVSIAPCDLDVPDAKPDTQSSGILALRLQERLTTLSSSSRRPRRTAFSLAGEIDPSPHEAASDRGHAASNHTPPSEAFISACQRLGMKRSAVLSWNYLAQHTRVVMAYYFCSWVTICTLVICIWVLNVDHRSPGCFILSIPAMVAVVVYGCIAALFWRHGPDCKRFLCYKVAHFGSLLLTLHISLANASATESSLPFQSRFLASLMGIFYVFPIYTLSQIHNPSTPNLVLPPGFYSLAGLLTFGMDLTLRTSNFWTDLALAVTLLRTVRNSKRTLAR